MGSGLILLVIVGAWLAVLVPMALRAHDESTSLSSVERFSDAMRVLARRDASVRRQARSTVWPARPESARGPVTPVPLERALLAARRRRVLLALVGLTVASLLGGLALASWCYVPGVIFAGLTIAYVAYLRRLELRRQERAYRRRAHPARRRPPLQRIAGVPDRMPARAQSPLTSPAARYEDPLPSPDTWTSPQFPVPTYVNAPVAPPRVVDLTRPGRWSQALDSGTAIAHAEPASDELDAALRDELDDILDRRRASGDW